MTSFVYSIQWYSIKIHLLENNRQVFDGFFSVNNYSLVTQFIASNHLDTNLLVKYSMIPQNSGPDFQFASPFFSNRGTHLTSLPLLDGRYNVLEWILFYDIYSNSNKLNLAKTNGSYEIIPVNIVISSVPEPPITWYSFAMTMPLRKTTISFLSGYFSVANATSTILTLYNAQDLGTNLLAKTGNDNGADYQFVNGRLTEQGTAITSIPIFDNYFGAKEWNIRYDSTQQNFTASFRLMTGDWKNIPNIQFQTIPLTTVFLWYSIGIVLDSAILFKGYFGVDYCNNKRIQCLYSTTENIGTDLLDHGLNYGTDNYYDGSFLSQYGTKIQSTPRLNTLWGSSSIVIRRYLDGKNTLSYYDNAGIQYNVSEGIRFYIRNTPEPQTDYRIPNAPVNVVAIPTFASALVYWSAPEITGTVQIGKPPVKFYKVVSNPDQQTVITPALSTYIYSLRDNVPYTFTVVAITDKGTSFPVITNSVISVNTSPPNPPIYAVAIIDPNTTHISWYPPVATASSSKYPITYYKVLVMPENQVYTVPANTPFLNLQNVDPNTNHQFFILAGNILGESKVSDPARLSFLTSPIGAPIHLSVVLGNQTATILWTEPNTDVVPVGTILYYLVSLTAEDGSISRVIVPAYTAVANYSTVFNGILNNHDYTVSVEGLSADTLFAAASTSFIGATAPFPPYNLKISQQSKELSTILLSWNSWFQNGQYPIQYFTVVSYPPRIFLQVDGKKSQVYINELSNDTAFRFFVYATNAMGTSAASIPSEWTIDPKTTSLWLYKKLKTGGNDPTSSSRIKYSHYIQSYFYNQTVNTDGGAFATS